MAYEDGRGILREIMVICTKQDFAISRVRVEREQSIEGELEQRTDLPTADAAPKLNKGIVTVALEVQGTRSVAKLAERLAEIDGVVAVNATDVNLVSD